MTAAQQKPVNQPHTEISCGEDGKDLEHVGQCALGTRVGKHCCSEPQCRDDHSEGLASEAADWLKLHYGGILV